MCAGVSVGLAVLAGAAWVGPAGAAAQKPNVITGVRLSAGPLGIDVAPWTNPASLTALRPQLEAAHVTQIHYGGGIAAVTSTRRRHCSSRLQALPSELWGLRPHRTSLASSELPFLL